MTRFLLICLGGGTLIVNVVGSFAIGLVQQVGTTTLVIPEGARLFLRTRWRRRRP